MSSNGVDNLFSPALWEPALETFTNVTGLTVELFDASGGRVPVSPTPTPLYALFADCGYDTGLFQECALRSMKHEANREVVVGGEYHGLTVVCASLALEGEIVGAAVAGYALAGFSQVAAVQRWSKAINVPFNRLWDVVRTQSPIPERRLKLHGELLQTLGDALLRENHRTRQSEQATAHLKAIDAAKDEFLAILSHELRAPLAPILGWAGVLKKSQAPEHVRDAADAIERNALLQRRLIDDLLDMNLITHGTVRLDMRVHELNGLVQGALEPSAAEVERKSIKLAFIGADESICVMGDSGRLQQVFRNLLSNAVKFTPAGGIIRVTVRRKADTAVVTVEDSGKGIEPSFMPFVFGMFTQQEQGTRREHEGLGIGLSLVQRLTELHGGRVVLSSEGAGRGTMAVVTLPVVEESTASPSAVPVGTEKQSPLAGLHILLVDDSDDAREPLRLLLRSLGAHVEAVRDGRDGLEIARTSPLDLVLCDLRMPMMDGYEFIRQLGRNSSTLVPPVIALSGLASEADRWCTSRAGFEAHLAKPVDERTLVATLNSVLSHPRPRRSNIAP